MSLRAGDEMSEGERPERQIEVTRAYGVLATSLNEVLGEARVALQPHEELLADGTLADLDAILAAFAARRVRVAVYGEVKAGKSTLINAIAGRELSPAAFDPLTSVPVRATYGTRLRWRAGDRIFETADELTEVMRDGATHDEIVVETDLDLLQLGGQVDLLDTPGVGSEERFDQISAEALRSLDAVILVVRYPALFTRFTRRLMEGLEGDIGKLFVVWNLDADCAELSDEERLRHAETLRANVAGAHELFLVDARAGFRAAVAGDAAAREASGLTRLVDGLRRFAASDERGLTALREAAKRAHQRLAAAHAALAARRGELEETLSRVRARLQTVRDEAESDSGTVRGHHADFQAAVGTLSRERAASAEKLAARATKQLRAARRRWVRRGDYQALEEEVATTLRTYADAVETLCRDTNEALQNAARSFDTALATTDRKRTEPRVDEISPEERRHRAADGRLRLVRRLLWRRWYAPGLETLLTVSVKNDRVAQETWFEEAAQAAERAAAETRDRKVAEIERRAQSKSEAIKVETDFDARTAEHEALKRHVPIVAARLQSVDEINTQARALIQ